MPQTITGLLGKIAALIINPLIVLGFTVATIFLFWGIIQLIWGADGGDLDARKRNVRYGIIGLFIMFSVIGILHLVLNTFGISCPENLFFCP